MLRPLVEAFKQRDDQEMLVSDRHGGAGNLEGRLDPSKQSKSLIDKFPQYSFHLICDSQAEVEILESITTFATAKELAITMLESNNIKNPENSDPKEIDIKVKLVNKSDSDELIDSDKVILSFKTITTIKTVRWEILES